MFDPRLTPTRTAKMLGDRDLCQAIDRMRPRRRRNSTWPYVERLLDIDGRVAWAVDDGVRYVVVGRMVWRPEDLGIASAGLRKAAKERDQDVILCSPADSCGKSVVQPRDVMSLGYSFCGPNPSAVVAFGFAWAGAVDCSRSW